ncbi:hypothetical protein I3843_14G033000 [Carya illinoinensis]|nr:hypothetical protein I3843_14G033000 [Carya illinoinensis]
MAMISRILRGSMAALTVLDLSMTFTTTVMSSTMDRAWYTLAKLPRPSRRPNWYFPRMVVGGNGSGTGTLGSMAREVGGRERRGPNSQHQQTTQNMGLELCLVCLSRGRRR